MSLKPPRPKFTSFRATKFHGENSGPADGQSPWSIRLTQKIQISLGVAVAEASGELLQALVKITLEANARSRGNADLSAEFLGEYEAKFDYAADVTEEQVAPLMSDESYQYVLVAQAFPLAMTHFRRELQSLGFDARELPLGI